MQPQQQQVPSILKILPDSMKVEDFALKATPLKTVAERVGLTLAISSSNSEIWSRMPRHSSSTDIKWRLDVERKKLTLCAYEGMSRNNGKLRLFISYLGIVLQAYEAGELGIANGAQRWAGLNFMPTVYADEASGYVFCPYMAWSINTVDKGPIPPRPSSGQVEQIVSAENVEYINQALEVTFPRSMVETFIHMALRVLMLRNRSQVIARFSDEFVCTPDQALKVLSPYFPSFKHLT